MRTTSSSCPCTRISTCSAGRRRRCSACYRAYPSLARARLAAVHFALAAVSALAFPVGVALAVTNVTVAVAIVASLLWLGGAVIFLANLVRLLAAPAAGPAAIAERSEAVIRDP